jgi:hypothetical protein
MKIPVLLGPTQGANPSPWTIKWEWDFSKRRAVSAAYAIGRPVSARIQEHKRDVRQGFTKKCEVSEHGYEGHRTGWEQTEILKNRNQQQIYRT